MGTAAHNVRALGVSAFMARQRRLLQAGAALSALMLPAVASGQTATTLDEVVVRGPKPAPAPRPAERPRAKPADTPSTERSTTAPAASTQARVEQSQAALRFRRRRSRLLLPRQLQASGSTATRFQPWCRH